MEKFNNGEYLEPKIKVITIKVENAILIGSLETPEDE